MKCQKLNSPNTSLARCLCKVENNSTKSSTDNKHSRNFVPPVHQGNQGILTPVKSMKK